VGEEQKHICVARASNNERDCDAWSLLLLAATVRSYAHMPLGISDRNNTQNFRLFCSVRYSKGNEQQAGLWSRNSNFRLLGSRSRHLNCWLWLRLQHLEDFGSKLKSIVLYLYNSLAQQTISVGLETKFQAPAPSPSSKSFWLHLQPSKISWTPVPQPWQQTPHFTSVAILSWQPSSKELLVRAVACSVMQNVNFRHWRNPVAQNIQAEPTLNKVFQLLQAVEPRLAQVESIDWIYVSLLSKQP